MIEVRIVEPVRDGTPERILFEIMRVYLHSTLAPDLPSIPKFANRLFFFVSTLKVEVCKTPLPTARAARQLQAAGRTVAPGQFIRFVYTRDASMVHAWDLHEEVDPRLVDTRRYCTLLDRSVETVLEQHMPVPRRLF